MGCCLIYKEVSMKHEASINVFFVKRLARLAGGLLFATGLFLSSPAIFAADNPQDDAAFTCSSAVNVMDCIKQTGTGAPAPTQPLDVTALPINSGLLGFTGPVSVGIRYDNYLAWILDFGYVQSFLDNNAAAALKLSAGLNERRANVSLGYAITPKQQIKLTYEYLTQNLPFDFASGKVDEWVNQNALGASYRYIIGHNILKNIELYGTYTKASSKELTEKEMYVNNLLTQINYRRIAGGTEMTAGGNVTLTPLKGTILKVGAGYSSLSFDTKWQDKEATAALVYNAELAHLLTPTTLVSTGIGNTASGRTHTAKVSQILPWSLEASLIGQYVATTNDIPGSTSVSASLSYPAPKTYENMITAGLSSIKDWVEKPVIYHSRVLAKAEEKLVQVQITTKPIPPATVPVGTTLSPQIQTKDYFQFNPEVYNKINYQIVSVVNKAAQTPAPNNLNLTVTPVDNYQAIVTSSAPTTPEMLAAGQNVTYTVTLQAQGYRNGQVVSNVQNPFDITVGVNPDLGQANWVTTPTLPAAKPDTSYNGGIPIPLNDPKYITPTISGETFKFGLVENTQAPWVSLSADNLSLIATSGTKVPSTIEKSVTITLNATSNSSGLTAKPTDQLITIPINNTIVLPTWTNNPSLPAATDGETYSLDPGVVPPVKVLDPNAATSGGFLTQTLLNDKPLGDTVTFNITPGSENMATPCRWLAVTADHRSLTSTGIVTPAADCFAYIDVTSTKGNSVVTSSLPQNKITVNSATYTLPKWISGEKLPNAIIVNGQKGSYMVNGTAYPSAEAVLNPYINTTKPFLTQTLKNNDPLTSDSLKFSIKPNSCSWLSFTDGQGSQKTQDSVSGTLTGTATTSCTLYLSVRSDTANKSEDIAAQNITVVNLPRRNPGQDPSWNSGATYTSKALDPYNSTDNSTYFTKTTNTADNSSVPDNLTNFEIIHSTGEGVCGDWLTLNSDKTALTGTAPIQENTTTCTVNLQAISSFQIAPLQLPLTIRINSSGAPVWMNGGINSLTVNYPVTDPSGFYKFYLDDFIEGTKAGVTFTKYLINPNLASGGISDLTQDQAPSNRQYVKITPKIGDIDNATPPNPQAKFTVDANLTTSSPGTFNVQVKADLTNPLPLPGAILPPAMVGKDYPPIDINPYTNPNSPLYRTKVSATDEPLPADNLEFTRSDLSGKDKPCTWTQITLSGTLSAINKVDTSSVNDCFLYYDVYSAKNNKKLVGAGSILIPASLTLPNWSNGSKITGEIKFDTTNIDNSDPKNRIDLTAMQLASSQTDVLKFVFDDTVNHDNWTIQHNGTDSHYYLLRQKNPNLNGGSFDASTVGGAEIVAIIASNEKGTAPSQQLSITIDPDSNVQLRLNPGKTNQTLETIIGTQNTLPITASDDPNNNFVQTVTQNGDLISKDTISINSGNNPTGAVVTNTNSTSKHIIAYYDDSIKGIVIPSNLNQEDPGSYSNPTLTNIVSRARGAEATPSLPMQGYLTIKIIPALEWKSTQASMKFDATDVNLTGSENGPILLNDMVYNPELVSNLNFKFNSGDTSGRFKIQPNGSNWYLIRTQTIENGVTVVDASDITAPQPLQIYECSGETCGSATAVTINVLPDPNVTVRLNPNIPAQNLTALVNQSAAVQIINPNVNESIIQTIAPPNNALISGDAITAPYAAVATNPANNNSIIAYYDGGRNIVTSNTLDNAADAGVYTNLKLQQLNSNARGKTISSDLELTGWTININSFPQWKTTVAPIKFDVLDLSGKGSTDGPILLNIMIVNSTLVPDLNFKLTNPSADAAQNFTIIQDPNKTSDWYLIRTKRTENGVEYVSAMDVDNTTPSIINVSACSGTQTCADKPLAITIKPDNLVTLKWIGGKNWIIKNDGNWSRQCYYNVYDINNQFAPNRTSLASYIGTLRVKDKLTMNCAYNGGPNADLGETCKNRKRIGYMGSDSSQNCDSIFMVSAQNLTDGDQCNYNGGDSTNYVPLFLNLTSKAKGVTYAQFGAGINMTFKIRIPNENDCQINP